MGDAPDVKMLCAIAQHSSALKIIASIGGLHALSLIAAEGELSAIVALKTACEENPSILIDVDGHLSVMKLISEDESISWRDEAARRKIETAVFELLTDMCSRAKGRKAVVNAGQCADCIAHAAHVIGALVEEEVEVVEIAEAPEEKDEEEEEGGTDTEAEPETPIGNEEKEPAQSSPSKLKKKKPSGEATLESAALSFLAKVVSVESSRQSLMADKHFIATLSLLAKDTTSFDLQLQTVAFLVQVAPYAKAAKTDGAVSTTELAEAFIEVLQVQSPIQPKSRAPKLNVNSLKSIAAGGLSIIFNDTPEELQIKAINAVCSTWMATVKKNTIQRSTGTDSDRSNSDALAYNLSVLMVSSSTWGSLRTSLVDMDLLKSMVHIVEWRYDSKASADGQMYWDASVSNSIQHLANVICATEENQKATCVSVKALSATVVTMARPGKAPRKTCDFTTALRPVVDSKRDFAGAAAAQRILARIVD